MTRRSPFCRSCFAALAAVALLRAIAVAADAPASQPTTQPVVRVAVIGGMTDTGFWDAITDRFEKATNIRIKTVVTGNKDMIDPVFRKGGIDLITMHASDTIINLCADGYAMDPQPWVRNDLILVGPAADPAGIKGTPAAVDALKKIVASKSLFVVHASLGAQDVLRNIMEPAGLVFSTDTTTVLLDDHQRQVLAIAAAKNAYTLIGRIPFRTGKLPNAGLVIMCEGDLALRRPYLVAVADPLHVPDAHLAEARRLQAFLRCADTQAFIATYGKGMLDDKPLFFPIPQLATETALAQSGGLSVTGEVKTPLLLDAAALAALPQQTITATDHTGKSVKFTGPLLRDVMKQAGVPIGSHQMRGAALRLFITASAADGYEAVFAATELDEDFRDRPIIVATKENDAALDAATGPLRLVVGDEARQARWVRRLVSLNVTSAN